MNINLCCYTTYMKTKKLKETLIGLALIPCILILVGCVNRPVEGIITDKETIEAHSKEIYECVHWGWVTQPSVDFEGNLTFNESYECIRKDYVTHHYPQTWHVTIKGETDKENNTPVASYKVSEAIYDRALIGYYFNYETKEVTAR